MGGLVEKSIDLENEVWPEFAYICAEEAERSGLRGHPVFVGIKYPRGDEQGYLVGVSLR